MSEVPLYGMHHQLPGDSRNPFVVRCVVGFSWLQHRGIVRNRGAYRRDCGIFTCGLFKKFLCSPLRARDLIGKEFQSTNLLAMKSTTQQDLYE